MKKYFAFVQCKTSAFVSNSFFKLVLEQVCRKLKICINPFPINLQLFVQFVFLKAKMDIFCMARIFNTVNTIPP